MTDDGIQNQSKPMATSLKATSIDMNAVAKICDKGSELYDRGQHVDAIKTFEAVLRLEPENSDALCNMGSSYFALCQYQKAIMTLNTCIRFHPEEYTAHFNKAAAHYELGQYQAARDAYDEASKIDDKDPDMHMGKGHAIFDLYEELAYKHDNKRENFAKQEKLIEEALACYNRTLELSPEHEEAQNMRDLALTVLDNLIKMRSELPETLDESEAKFTEQVKVLESDPEFKVSLLRSVIHIEKEPEGGEENGGSISNFDADENATNTDNDQKKGKRMVDVTSLEMNLARLTQRIKLIEDQLRVLHREHKSNVDREKIDSFIKEKLLKVVFVVGSNKVKRAVQFALV